MGWDTKAGLFPWEMTKMMSKNDQLCCFLCLVGMISAVIGIIGYLFGLKDGMYMAIGGVITIIIGLFNFEP